MSSSRKIPHADRFTRQQVLKFLIPSLAGVLLFMVPLPYNEGLTIPVAWLAKGFEALLGGALPFIAVVLMGVALFGSLAYAFGGLRKNRKHALLRKLFAVSPLLLLARMLGFLFALLTLLEWGPEWLISEDTGGLLLESLLPLLIAVFLFAGFFLPLLMNFGLLELCGALMSRIMRPVFTLPGRSSIDCVASWIGDGTIGVLMTNKQYEEGYYTQREAAVIGTTFSVVSLTFSIVVLAELGLEHLLMPYYLTIVITGFVLALVMPRIPPLSRKPDTYISEAAGSRESGTPENTSAWRWGWSLAVRKAQDPDNRLTSFAKSGMSNVLDMWLGVLPIVMTLGTISLILAEYTPLFRWLGAPFVPLLEWMQVPEAAAAAQTMVVGFADMFLPAILGSSIESELTRFVIASLSVTQLIYMSEVGGLLLGSKLPIGLKDLILIFVLRTLIALPIIVLMAHWLL
ncbi:YjiH family protein [Xylanibacillus composti]|uniref:YjiH family protein n=1 Tax=Xylanibacillus composti TaxID=1572762 RepID=UPI0028F6AB14|nr:YjiH family protein [Xylanibacillus composti]MDT9726107.1 YjiH family protein [Xylanibacillus composti]